MSGAGDIRAGRAFVEIYADNQVSRGLNAAKDDIQKVGDELVDLGKKSLAIGLAITGALAAATKFYASTGEELMKMSAQTGLSVESLSKLIFAADQVGASGEALVGAFKGMDKALYAAATGSKEEIQVLGRLGLTLAQLSAMSPEERFKTLADRLSQIKDPSLRAAEAMKVFGRGAMELLPLIEDGAAGIEELESQADALGLTISGPSALAAAKLERDIRALWATIKRAAYEIGEIMAPAAKVMVKHLTDGIVATTRWLAANPQFITGLARVGKWLTIGGVALLTFGIALKAAAFGLGILATALAFLLTPLGALTAGLIAGISLFARFDEEGKRITSEIADGFRAMVEDVEVALGAMGSALAAGDLGLAARVLWATLKLEWAKGTKELKDTWHALMLDLFTTFADMETNIAAAMIGLVYNIKVAWYELKGFFANLFSDIARDAETVFAYMGGVIAKGVYKLSGKLGGGIQPVPGDLSDKIDQQVGEEMNSITNERFKYKQDAAAARDSDLKALYAATTGMLKILNTNNSKDKSQATSDTQQNIDATAADLAKAMKEWQDAITAANAATSRAALTPTAQRHHDDVQQGLLGLSDIKPRGTFNSDAILGLQSGGGTWQRDMLDESKKAAKSLRRIENNGGGIPVI